MGTTFRLALVEWQDSFNTDTFYVDELMKTPRFKTSKKAIEWANKNMEKIKEFVDKDIFATDLYCEEWYDDDYIQQDSNICCLYQKEGGECL